MCFSFVLNLILNDFRFKLKYHPEENLKRKNEQQAYIKVSIDFYHS